MSATQPVRNQREEILALLGTAMDRVRAWNGQEEAQSSAEAEAEVTTLKRQLANCKEALKPKVASLLKAEKGQVELQKALADKEAELVAAPREVAKECKRGANTEYLRGKLRTAEADIRSLQRHHGILQSDLEEARSKEKQREKAFDGMKTDMDQLRKRWEQVQARLVAEVERTNTENARLHQVMSDQQAELGKERKEREAAERRHQQSQVELGLAQLELTVAKDIVEKARASRNATVKENDRLRGQLEKRAFSAQANLKRIVERFREQTKVAIQAATAIALQSWAEQAVEL
jgi:DNA repair exonuclease SbcCD ATPase subunit